MVCVSSVFFSFNAVAMSSHVKSYACIAFICKMVHGRKHTFNLSAQTMDKQDGSLRLLIAA